MAAGAKRTRVVVRMSPSSCLALALASALHLAGTRTSAPAPVTPAWIVCSPAAIQLPGGQAQPALHPLVVALERARPGTRILVEPGDYAAFSIGFDSSAPNNARTSGGTREAPIVVEGRGRVRILGKQGDAIAIDQKVPNAWITFRNLEIHCGDRAGVLFTKQGGGRAHLGFVFEDCDVLGGWDHLRGKGRKSKWGVWAHSLAEFRFAGVSRPARVANVRFEHGFYLQNPRGDVTIENVRATRLGRTFLQVTARAEEGPPGRGKLLVRACHVEDVAIAAEDGFKGGSAITLAGRLPMTMILEDNVVRAGFAPEVQRLSLRDVPYGTGALAAWQGGEREPNGTLILRRNRFEFAPGCGDRPLVAIGGTRTLRIERDNRFASGGSQPALALDPVDDQGQPISPPNGSVHVAQGCEIEGRITLAGREPTAADVAEWRRQPARVDPPGLPPSKSNTPRAEPPMSGSKQGG
jgi:hypothetical protein